MNRVVALIWVGFAVMARMIPHVANLSPFNSLMMVIGSQHSRRQATLITLTSLLISDALLALCKGYPMLGTWSFFTYSGFVLMTLSGQWLRRHPHSLTMICGYGVSITTLYWLWTNLGTWLIGGMYQHTLMGLTTCYLVALPFLERSLLSTLIFLPFCMAALHHLQQRRIAL